MSEAFYSVGARVLMMGYWRGVAQDEKATVGMRKMARDLIRYEEELCKVERQRDAVVLAIPRRLIRETGAAPDDAFAAMKAILSVPCKLVPALCGMCSR